MADDPERDDPDPDDDPDVQHHHGPALWEWALVVIVLILAEQLMCAAIGTELQRIVANLSRTLGLPEWQAGLGLFVVVLIVLGIVYGVYALIEALRRK